MYTFSWDLVSVWSQVLHKRVIETAILYMSNSRQRHCTSYMCKHFLVLHLNSYTFQTVREEIPSHWLIYRRLLISMMSGRLGMEFVSVLNLILIFKNCHLFRTVSPGDEYEVVLWFMVLIILIIVNSF